MSSPSTSTTPLTRRRVLGSALGVPVAGVAAGLAGSALELAHAAPAAAVAPAQPRARRLELAYELYRDMHGHHAGRMHGVPITYTWSRHPYLVRGSHAGSFTAMNPWGQIYESAEGSPAQNVRVACKDIGGWLLSRRTGRWHRVAFSHGVNGANYVEDFVGNVNYPAPLRTEPDGSVSSTLGNGLNFHFYPLGPRVVFDPDELAGVITFYTARVIKDDPSGPDERAAARYLASCGGDYWLNTTTDGSNGEGDGIGCGKARWLTPRWKTMTMSTVPLRVLRRTCPPMPLHGRS